MPEEVAAAAAAAPAAPAVSAPEAAAPAAPETPAEVTPQSVADAAPTPEAAIEQWGQRKAEERAKPADAAPAEPEKPAEGVKPEEIAPDTDAKPVTEAKPEEKPAEAKEPEFNIEDFDALAPKELDEAIKANPELAKVLEANPQLKGQLFRAARLSTEAAGYREIFPDLETAKQAAETSAKYSAADELVLGTVTREGTDKFLSWLDNELMFVDDKGNPARDAETGAIKYHPARNGFYENFRTAQFDFIRKQAEGIKDPDQRDQIQAALDALSEWISPSSQAKEDLPEHLKQRETAINEREQALVRTQAAEREAQNKASIERAADKVTGEFDKIVKPILEKPELALTEFTREAAAKEIETQTIKRLSGNPQYRAQRRSILRNSEPGDERESKLVALDMKYIQSILPGVVREVLPKASAPVIKAHEDRRAKQTAQETASRSEPKGATSAAGPAKLQSPEEAVNSMVATFVKDNGRQPNTEELLNLGFKAKQAQRAAMAGR